MVTGILIKFHHFIMIINGGIILIGQVVSLSHWRYGFESRYPYKVHYPRTIGKVGIRDTGHSGFKSRITCWSCHNRVRIKKELP